MRDGSNAVERIIAAGGIPIVAYHGTRTLSVARRIEHDGLRHFSYVARHLEDALAFGGDFVWRLVVPLSVFDLKGWQACLANDLPSDHLLELCQYTQRQLTPRNKAMADAVFQYHIAEARPKC